MLASNAQIRKAALDQLLRKKDDDGALAPNYSRSSPFYKNRLLMAPLQLN